MRQVRGHVAGDERAHVATDARVDGDVLLAVGARVRDRIADHARADLELPEHLPGRGVRRLEPYVETAVEDDVPRCRDRAAPHGERLLDAPDLLSVRRIPRDDLALVVAGPALLGRVRPDVRRARDVGDLAPLVV